MTCCERVSHYAQFLMLTKQNLLAKEDVERAFGVGQGLFQDFEVSTQL